MGESDERRLNDMMRRLDVGGVDTGGVPGGVALPFIDLSEVVEPRRERLDMGGRGRPPGVVALPPAR